MSEFLKFAWEVLSKIVYNLAALAVSLWELLVAGWKDYFGIFLSYFPTLGLTGKILSVLLMVILVAIAALAVFLVVRTIVIRIRLKHDKVDNAELYREIGRLNRQVLDLIDEKNKVLALKVNAMGGTEHIPYMGASALTEDVIPSVGNVTGIPRKGDTVANAEIVVQNASLNSTDGAESAETNRFPKLTLVDQRYADFVEPVFDDEITLAQLVDDYRRFACSQMHLYYTEEIIRRFVAGMASSKLLILEGISGTGKTSLPYSFSRFLDNPATMISVQPSYRDRTELLGYFNEFSKRFNETEFLRALYEAGYREEPSIIVLDEMNLARIEYYLRKCCPCWKCPARTSGCWIWFPQPGQVIPSIFLTEKSACPTPSGLWARQTTTIPPLPSPIRYMTAPCPSS